MDDGRCSDPRKGVARDCSISWHPATRLNSVRPKLTCARSTTPATHPGFVLLLHEGCDAPPMAVNHVLVRLETARHRTSLLLRGRQEPSNPT